MRTLESSESQTQRVGGWAPRAGERGMGAGFHSGEVRKFRSLMAAQRRDGPNAPETDT